MTLAVWPMGCYRDRGATPGGRRPPAPGAIHRGVHRPRDEGLGPLGSWAVPRWRCGLRLGDIRVLWGFFPLSRFIARATSSRFSHAAVVAVERGEPVVYDYAASGVQRLPFALSIADNIGAFGLKRLKPEQRRHIPGALAYCPRMFEAKVPFDRGFRPDDDRLYCTELVEKAFRSAGLPLSEPVQIGDWKNLGQFPLTTASILAASACLLDAPITLDQPVYLPGDDRQGLWGSHGSIRWRSPSLTRPATRRVLCPEGSACGDASMLLFVALELRSFVRTVRRAAAHLDGG